MAMALIIFGTGPSSRYSTDIAEALEIKISGYLDDNRPAGELIGGYPVIGSFDVARDSNYLDQYEFLVPIGDQRLRAKIGDQIIESGGRLATLVHPTCVVAKDVNLGKGTVVNALSYLHAGCILGDHVIVENHVSVGVDNRLGDGVQVAPGCSINYGVKIEDYCMIGSGATLNPRVTVGGGSVIGAGATVVSDIPRNKVAVGVPAKVIKDVQR
jgi:acetyltransferase EpsM